MKSSVATSSDGNVVSCPIVDGDDLIDRHAQRGSRGRRCVSAARPSARRRRAGVVGVEPFLRPRQIR